MVPVPKDSPTLEEIYRSLERDLGRPLTYNERRLVGLAERFGKEANRQTMGLESSPTKNASK